ncbi:hypothetical protein LguiA_006754 [Lonicera macranthoides]
MTLSFEQHIQKSAQSNGSIKSYIRFTIAPAKNIYMRTALLSVIRSESRVVVEEVNHW